MMASVVGVTSAAPSPCTARAAMSTSAEPARPAASEAVVKTANPIRNRRLRPNASARRPPASRRPANTRM
jgi:curli biogenesis system outer membrane secretion channel CsgG